MCFLNRLILASGLALVCLGAVAGQVSPTPGYEVNTSSTLPDSSAHIILSDGSSVNGYRTDCLFQNLGTHNMNFKFEVQGGSTATVTTSDKVVFPGGSFNCNNGVTTDSTALSVIGTSGDAYSVSEQFVRGQ